MEATYWWITYTSKAPYPSWTKGRQDKFLPLRQIIFIRIPNSLRWHSKISHSTRTLQGFSSSSTWHKIHLGLTCLFHGRISQIFCRNFAPALRKLSWQRAGSINRCVWYDLSATIWLVVCLVSRVMNVMRQHGRMRNREVRAWSLPGGTGRTDWILASKHSGWEGSRSVIDGMGGFK